jgi:membrane protease YdiL (CAAX protease family)
MNAMNRSLGGVRAALLAGWLALSAGGVLYARVKGIPNWVAIPILAAFLIEYPFYLAAGVEAWRERFARRLPWWLVASFLAPYVVYAANTGEFRWAAFTQLAALATALSLWYIVLPRGPWADAAFLALAASVVLGKYLERIYTSPLAGLRIEVLGHLALIRVCAMVMLVERRVAGTGFGFIPSWEEWKIGLRQFLYFVVVGIPLAWLLRAANFAPGLALWKIAATFAGVLWVVALSEEFFFRGLLQQWLEQWTGSATAALAGAAILFGAAHLGFRHFPNWRFALLAAVAGWFYGRAYNQAKSIRASMAAHAMVVTLWRVLAK